MSVEKVKIIDLGRISYEQSWKFQTECHEELKLAKKQLRDQNSTDQSALPSHKLILCEHNPVYTLGKSGDMDHLLLNDDDLNKEQIEFFKINRGGDITFHGPGQLVVYPIFDLDRFFTDVHKYVRFLEQAVINTLEKYGIKGERLEDFTGVWVKTNGFHEMEKICAIGVHLSRWVTMHGLALNVNTNLDYFKNIIPCGIDPTEKGICSIEKLLGHPIDMNEVKEEIVKQFSTIYNFQILEHDKKESS